MIAKTFFGFEEILSKELQQLGAQKVQKGVRSVSFYGDLGFLYKCNLALRTATRILLPIKDFDVREKEHLYRGVKGIAWDNYLTPDMTFKIEVTEHQSIFKNSNYIGMLAKDAIVDQFREQTSERPSVEKDFSDVIIHIHIDRTKCSVSLDSSGHSLHHRGYRTQTNIAPINEVLAAGILLLSGWNGQSDFLDPMCGSGTFLVEAAMIACNIPANINRKEFAFERWLNWDADLFEAIIDSLMKKTREFNYKIVGFDKAPSAISKAKQNILNAQLEDYITVEHEDFFKSKKENESHLHMVFNPPYGERLTVEEQDFYSKIGTTLKHQYPDTQAWVFTGLLDAVKYVGLRPSRKIKLFNGKIETRLLNYQMYAGSKKASKNIEN